MPKLKRTPRRARKMERRKLARTRKLMAAMDQAVNADAPMMFIWKGTQTGRSTWSPKLDWRQR